jgi:heme exporter protein D
MDLQRFLAMGGYAAYVWPAYGVALVVLIGMLLLRWRRLSAAERDADGVATGGKRRRVRAREPGA